MNKTLQLIEKEAYYYHLQDPTRRAEDNWLLGELKVSLQKELVEKEHLIKEIEYLRNQIDLVEYSIIEYHPEEIGEYPACEVAARILGSYNLSQYNWEVRTQIMKKSKRKG